ncbi:MAG: oxygen-dependent coproporphyrinogen oxidase, partial [Blastocatellia bacterium]
MDTPLKQRASEFFCSLQADICRALEHADGGGRFRQDKWEREGGGGGQTRVLESGALFEKAGVNFSEVHGELQPAFASRMPIGEGTAFFATGVSLVLHPWNPMIPTVHANFRYLERGPGGWFGGGTDLTPYYPYHEDAVHFHRTLKSACDGFDRGFYPRFKKWCDEYFFIKHRSESRGVGGIFFDYLNGAKSPETGTGKSTESSEEPPGVSDRASAEPVLKNEKNPKDFDTCEQGIEQIFQFVQAAGKAFLPAYLPIVERRRDEGYTEREREHQLIRRGRYVEFNLVYDRGTVFGLETRGRTESILMSLPPMVRWVYD